MQYYHHLRLNGRFPGEPKFVAVVSLFLEIYILVKSVALMIKSLKVFLIHFLEEREN